MNSRLSLEAALRPLAARLGPVVREHEVLRVAATVHGKDTGSAANEARKQVLAWAQNRCGGRLPKEAWDYESFEYFSGGRNSLGVRLNTETADIWAIRADDPDKSVPGRVWTTEVVIGFRANGRVQFGTRLIVNTAESLLDIVPHTPGLVRQIVDVCGLSVGQDQLELGPWTAANDEDVAYLCERLYASDRTLPVVVVSVGDDAPDGQPLLDCGSLARALLGIAQVVILPSEQTWVLTRWLGRLRSVFGGAARVYLPGFSEGADPFRHRLFLADQLKDDVERNHAVRWICSMAASESIRRNRLGRDVPAFGDIRNASLLARQERLTREGASESEQLIAANAAIKALEIRLEEERATQEYFDEVASNEKERAEAAETQLRAANYHIRQLREMMRSAGQDVDGEIQAPESWAELADWCDTNFAGRVALAPLARRNSKDAEFEDIELVARCIAWLATDYRDGRIGGAEGDFRDYVVESGVRNSLCGGDDFDLDWQGRRHTVNWHIKNGGNTRDPQRCLRIYYFWEPETQQVVVADMPQHRRSAFT